MHVAIIMDGNGRWATRRGLPRTAGHKEGAKAVSATIEAAARYNIETLTLYAFSAANWERPSSEVTTLMRLLRRYLLTETHRCLEQSIRISVIGRRDRLSPSLVRSIEQAERVTANCRGLHVRVAIDYSAQYSLLEAARRAWQYPTLDTDEFRRLLDEVNHSALPAGDVDLLIRTGGEKRLSDFLLWECAYAELYFTNCLWPDFDADGFRVALADFASRQRRFGRIAGEHEEVDAADSSAAMARCFAGRP